MKRTLCILLVIVVGSLFSLSFAESGNYDLSSLSYGELVVLQNEIDNELKSRPEWPGVKVPAGTWVVGIDIPAGEYSIAMCNENQTGRMSIWEFAVNDYHTNGGCVYPLVFGYEYSVYGRCVLEDGYIVDSTIETYFCPPLKLGF